MHLSLNLGQSKKKKNRKEKTKERLFFLASLVNIEAARLRGQDCCARLAGSVTINGYGNIQGWMKVGGRFGGYM